jgi:hypothetical protein
MIVYGYKGKETEVGRGQFFCSTCKKIRQYRKIRISRYFTLFFVPLFPYKTLAEYVECQGCFSGFKLEVLNSQNIDSSETEKPLERFELIGLWREIFQKIECKEILENKSCPPLITSSANAMQTAGGAIGVGKYDDARIYLKQVLIWSNQGLEHFKQGGKYLKPEWKEKYTAFLNLTTLLLTKMP